MHTPISILYMVLVKYCAIGGLAFFIKRGAPKYPSAKLETAEAGKNKIYFQCNQ